MDNLFKILSIALITCITCLIVKPIRPDFAILVSIVGGIIVLFYVITSFSTIFDVFNNIFKISGVKTSLYSVILKIIGIGYLTEFTANLCSDTGNSSLASKVGLAGKIIILFLALPIITNLLEVIMGILP